MRDVDSFRIARAIEEAGIYISIGLVIAGVLVAIALSRLAKVLRDQGQRLR